MIDKIIGSLLLSLFPVLMILMFIALTGEHGILYAIVSYVLTGITAGIILLGIYLVLLIKKYIKEHVKFLNI